MPETPLQKFTRLYPQFLAGKKWLDSRPRNQADEDDFLAKVIIPLSDLWESFTPAIRSELDGVMHMADMFGSKKLTLKKEV